MNCVDKSTTLQRRPPGAAVLTTLCTVHICMICILFTCQTISHHSILCTYQEAADRHSMSWGFTGFAFHWVPVLF